MVFAAERPAVLPEPTPLWPLTSFIGSTLGACALWLAWRMQRTGSTWARWLFALEHVVVGLIFGLAGSLLLALSTLTEHQVTYHNENLLLANPLMLCSLAGAGTAFASARAEAIARWGWYLVAGGTLLAIIGKMLPSFDQSNLEIISLLAPINFGFAATHARVLQSAAIWGSTRAAQTATPSKT